MLQPLARFSCLRVSTAPVAQFASSHAFRRFPQPPHDSLRRSNGARPAQLSAPRCKAPAAAPARRQPALAPNAPATPDRAPPRLRTPRAPLRSAKRCRAPDITEDELEPPRRQGALSPRRLPRQRPRLQRARRAHRPLPAGLLHPQRASRSTKCASPRTRSSSKASATACTSSARCPTRIPPRPSTASTSPQEESRQNHHRPRAGGEAESRKRNKKKAAPTGRRAEAASLPARASAQPIRRSAPPASRDQDASDAEAQAEIATAPPAERPADAKSVTTTTRRPTPTSFCGRSRQRLRPGLRLRA